MKASSLAVAAFAFISAATLSIVPSADGGLSVGTEEAQARVGRPSRPSALPALLEEPPGGRLWAGP